MKTLYARFKRKAMTGQCFLIIDAQNDYLDPWDRHKVTRLVSRINEVVAAFRECGMPIVWINTEFRADLTDAFLEMRDRNIALLHDRKASFSRLTRVTNRQKRARHIY